MFRFDSNCCSCTVTTHFAQRREKCVRGLLILTHSLPTSHCIFLQGVGSYLYHIFLVLERDILIQVSTISKYRICPVCSINSLNCGHFRAPGLQMHLPSWMWSWEKSFSVMKKTNLSQTGHVSNWLWNAVNYTYCSMGQLKGSFFAKVTKTWYGTDIHWFATILKIKGKCRHHMWLVWLL